MFTLRVVPFTILACLAWGVLPPVVLAQEEEDEAQEAERPQGIVPSYRSGLDSNKQRTGWTQSMNIDWGFADYFGNSTLTSSRTDDSGQNDLQLSVSGWRNRAEVALIEGLTLGVTGNFDRTRRLTTASENRNTTDDYGVIAGWKTVVRGWDATLNGQAGQKDVSTETKRSVGETGTLERTNQIGPSYQLGGAFKNFADSQRPDVTVEVTASTNSFRQETRERRDVFDLDFTNGVSERDTTLNSTNSASNFEAKFGWEPVKDLSVDVTGTRRISESLRPLTFQDGLERSEQDDRLLSVGVGFTSGKLTARAGLHADDRRGSSSATPSANKDATQERLQFDLGYELLGVSIESNFSSTTKRDDFRPVPGRVPNEDQDSEVNDFKLTLKRSLGARLSGEVVLQTYLDQKFYEDEFLDNDRRNLSGDFTLKYRPPVMAMDASVSFSYRDVRTVQVHPDRSANTNSGENLLVVFTINYDPLESAHIRQRYAISANSAVYDFDDEGQSDLTRRNDVTTEAQVRLLEHVRLELKHIYNFTNQGSYALDIDGVRRFGLTDERSRQDLELGMTYDPVTWLRLRGWQSLEATVSQRPDQPEVRNTVYELFLQASGTRTFGGIVSNFDVTRALTTREDHYWKVTLGVSRAF